MKELWIQAILLLPSTKNIDSFFLCYRPWIRDKSHLYLVRFRANNYHRPIDKWFYPQWVDGFGATPEEAIQNFITKWKKYAE